LTSNLFFQIPIAIVIDLVLTKNIPIEERGMFWKRHWFWKYYVEHDNEAKDTEMAKGGSKRYVFILPSFYTLLFICSANHIAVCNVYFIYWFVRYLIPLVNDKKTFISQQFLVDL